MRSALAEGAGHICLEEPSFGPSPVSISSLALHTLTSPLELTATDPPIHF